MNIKKKIAISFFVICILTILWNTLDSPEVSTQKSMSVLSFLTSHTNGNNPFWYFVHYNVRRIAHFGEFFLIGVALVVCCISVKKRIKANIGNMLFVGLFLAVVDEAVQLLNNRGARVSDVLIDFLGVVIGMITTYMLYIMRRHYRGNGKNESIDD